MATEAIYTKSLGGAEDLLLDASNSATVIQTRAGKELEITKINSSTIPYSGKFGDPSMVSIKDQLDTNSTDISSIQDILYPVDTILVLRAKTTIAPTVLVSGYYTKGDGAFGSNIFEWDNTSVEADNGGTIIKLDSAATGRYKLRYSGAVNVKWFGASNTNLGATLNLIMSFGFTNIVINAGTYTLEQSVIVLPSVSIIGEGYKEHNIYSTIINTSSLNDVAFKTDQSVGNFSGITIKNIRFMGGYLNQYTIKSHYPYTYISNISIENTSGYYNGLGIKLHNDGSVSGMGCWDSTITKCKIVLKDQPSTDPSVGLRLDINGGNVLIEQCDFVTMNQGIEIASGENIVIRNTNFNRIRDRNSTNGNILKAAINIGSSNVDSVKNVSVENCYIEGNSRSILIFGGSNINISNCYFDDLGAYDPGFANDGDITILANNKNISISNNYIKKKYGKQSFVYSPNSVSYIIENNYFKHDLGANTYYGVGRFQGTIYNNAIKNTQVVIENSITTTTDLSLINGTKLLGLTNDSLVSIFSSRYEPSGTDLIECCSISGTGGLYLCMAAQNAAGGCGTMQYITLLYGTAYVYTINKTGAPDIDFSVTDGKIYVKSDINTSMNVAIVKVK